MIYSTHVRYNYTRDLWELWAETDTLCRIVFEVTGWLMEKETVHFMNWDPEIFAQRPDRVVRFLWKMLR